MGWPSQVPENLLAFSPFSPQFPQSGATRGRHSTCDFLVWSCRAGSGQDTDRTHDFDGRSTYDVLLSGERNVSIVRDNLVSWKWQTHIPTIIHGKVQRLKFCPPNSVTMDSNLTLKIVNHKTPKEVPTQG